MEGYRLSPQQKRGWLIQQSDPGGHYLAQAVVEIGSGPDPTRLRSAVDAVCLRHEILRTRLERLPGVDMPFQVIHNEARPAFGHHDARRDPGTAWHRLPARRTAIGVDLASSGVLQADLVTLSETRSQLILTLPAVNADTLTMHHIAAEIHDAYTAGVRPVGADDNMLQYVDVAEWQNDLQVAPETRAGRSFWRERYESVPGADALPRELGWSTGPFRPASMPIAVGPDVRDAVQALAASADVSVETVFASAWQATLRRIANGAVAMALAAPNRPHPEMAPALGPFGMWLPHVCDPSGSSSFLTTLTAVARQSREMLRQQEFHDAADAGAAAVARVAFGWTVCAAPNTWAVTHAVSRDEPFALLLAGTEIGGSVRLELHYDTSCLPDEDAGRVREMFGCLLAAALRDPHLPLSSLPLADPGARERKPATGGPPTERGRAATVPSVHHVFEERAARLPHAIAVVAGDTRLSSQDLNAHANRIAHRLRRLGVSPETPVGLLVERSAELVAGLLGIMKAGGAYVPLDPALPAERVRVVLAEAGAGIVVADPHLCGGLPEGVVTLDPRDPGLGREPAGNLAGGAGPDHLAYVMFTSGSTGTPKGVGITHANLLAYTRSISGVMDLPDGAEYATVSTFAADLGHTVVFPALCTGGVLHVIPRELADDPDALAGHLASHAIDCLKIVPSQLRALLDAARPEAILPARWLVLGGEAPPPDLARRVAALAPRCRVLNHYGPTEATVGALTHTVDTARGDAVVPLGHPLPHTQAHVLDDRLRPTAMYEVGEIYLGGSGVARGYVGRPALTAERFVPDPFAAVPGARLYRTGDRARRLADGTLSFVGRGDQQVKLRGYRIEPGEVEAVLRDLPDVTDAAVVVRADQPGSPRLVAYVVATGPSASELRDHCAAHLPGYMVPAAFVLLARLPLTPNGKLSRSDLPAPALHEATPYARPRTADEETLAGIWARVLGVPQVGRDDSFFALGGDSILSIQVVARAAQAGLTLTPPLLFRHPTIASLAPRLGHGADGPAVAEQGLVTGPVPPTPIQRWFLDHYLLAAQHYNQALLVEPREPLDTVALETGLRTLVSHHDALRLRLRDGELDNAGALDPGRAVLTLVDLTETPADRRSVSIDEIADQVCTGIDLDAGCLLQAVHIRLSAGDERLLLVAHHLGVDSVSWRILLDDLATVYTQAVEHRPLALPFKTTSYQAWAHRLAGSADMGIPDVPHWTALLTGPGRTVPRDHGTDTAANTHGEARTLTVVLSPESTRGLLRATGTGTAERTLLAAAGRALRSWTGERRVVVDVERHGREPLADDIDLSRTTGWFTTTHPVALPAADGPRVVAGGLGYGLLRHASTDPAAAWLRSLPAPEVRFNYLGQVAESAAGALFHLLPESPGAAAEPRARRPYVVDITAVVMDRRLRVGWTYCPALHERATIQNLADQFLRELGTLLAAPHEEISDFADAELSEHELDDLMDQLDLLTTEGDL
jgi:amino acid adenylation domain-containing protein/non-ribosomal peptide synthase protein (TIGR01720 family)